MLGKPGPGDAVYGSLYENEELTIILEVLNRNKIDMLY
jgi:hypothetical protein